MAPPPADGARCAVATCGDWQLLPVRCAACDALHCTAHAAPHAHACAAAAAAAAAYDAIACPACGVALLPPSARSDKGGGWGGGADAVVAAHLDAGCPQGRRRPAATIDPVHPLRSARLRCSFPGCGRVWRVWRHVLHHPPPRGGPRLCAAAAGGGQAAADGSATGGGVLL